MDTLRLAWKRHPALTAVALAAMLLAALFAARLGYRIVYWSQEAHQNQPVEGWMPLRYVARSWQVPVEALIADLGLDADLPPRTTVAEVAAMRGEPEADTIKRLTVAIDRLRADRR
jgi:hypothetical protein